MQPCTTRRHCIHELYIIAIILRNEITFSALPPLCCYSTFNIFLHIGISTSNLHKIKVFIFIKKRGSKNIFPCITDHGKHVKIPTVCAQNRNYRTDRCKHYKHKKWGHIFSWINVENNAGGFQARQNPLPTIGNCSGFMQLVIEFPGCSKP